MSSDRVSLCVPGLLETHDLPAESSRMPGYQVCGTYTCSRLAEVLRQEKLFIKETPIPVGEMSPVPLGPLLHKADKISG